MLESGSEWPKDKAKLSMHSRRWDYGVDIFQIKNNRVAGFEICIKEAEFPGFKA